MLWGNAPIAASGLGAINMSRTVAGSKLLVGQTHPSLILSSMPSQLPAEMLPVARAGVGTQPSASANCASSSAGSWVQ